MYYPAAGCPSVDLLELQLVAQRVAPGRQEVLVQNKPVAKTMPSPKAQQPASRKKKGSLS